MFNKKTLDKLLITILKVLKSFMIFGLIFVILLPFLEIFVNSIKSYSDKISPNIYWIPENPTLNNIISTYRQLTAENAFYNSLLLSTLTAIIQVLICALSGYAFSKLKFKGSNILFWIIILSIFIPMQSLHTARTLFFSNTYFFSHKLIGSKYSIFIMTFFGMGYLSPIFIYLFRQYFKSISNEILEQSQIDGASIFQSFYKIMLPNAKGAIITTAIITFVWTYNDHYLPSLYQFSSNNFIVLSIKLSGGRYRNPQTTALLMIIPLLIIYIALQKYLIDNIKKTIIC